MRNWFLPKRRRLKCAAVTPVGPGHVERARECKSSIEAAWCESRGPFSELEFYFVDDSAGKLGRSKARNDGTQQAQQAGADWIFFLDADDLMTPRAFSIFEEHADQFDAVWGLMAIKSPDEREHHIRFPQAMTLRSLDELLLFDPFMTLYMGHFVRTSAALTLPFDEAMDAGEDFDYYLKAWKDYRCIKLPEVLSVNRADRHSTGPRAATSDQWRISATAQLAAGAQARSLKPHSNRSTSALNRCSEEAQSFSRARGEMRGDELKLLASRLPYSGLVDVCGCAGGDFALFSNNDDPVCLSLGWIGDYQAATTRLWQVLAADAPLVADIGAGKGYYALLAARAAPAAEIRCFESIEADFLRLELNLAMNGVRNVTAFEGFHKTQDLIWAAESPARRLIRLGPAALQLNVFAEIADIVARATPDIVVAADNSASSAAIQARLKQSGYRIYAIDDDNETVALADRLGEITDIRSVNLWATTRPDNDVGHIVAAAYCKSGDKPGS
ncbi:MAG: FkbM family methyltransferase [Betaproteobacteria bacterium]|nr:FkbM family methyltransferase [Betaproteobacteria bacterium]